MVKINDTNPTRGYGNIKKKLQAASSGATSFAEVLSSASSSGNVGGANNVSSTANVGSLLSLQEVSDEDIARNQAIKHGDNLLKSLESIRQSLLLGRIPADVLRTLESRLKNQRSQTLDPQLHAIMDEIELRAAVELAKLDMAARSGGYL